MQIPDRISLDLQGLPDIKPLLRIHTAFKRQRGGECLEYGAQFIRAAGQPVDAVFVEAIVDDDGIEPG